MGALKGALRIFITGAGGFVGRNLTEYLTQRHTVFAPSHSELELLDERAVQSFIRRRKIDVVVHCANIGGGRDTVGVTDVVYRNLRMFYNVVRNAAHVKKIIHCGSGAEYHLQKLPARVRETFFDTYVPEDDYGFSKYVMAKYILASRMPIIGARIFGLFGKYENYETKFISKAILRNLLSLPLTVVQNKFFDYLYIEDFVKIIDYMLTHRVRSDIYNVTSGRRIDLVTIAKKVNAVGTGHSKIRVVYKGLNHEYTGSNAKLLREVRRFAFTPFEQAVRELYAWYEAHLNELDLARVRSDENLKYLHVKK